MGFSSFSVLFIIGIELLAISCVMLGFLFGRYSRKEKITKIAPLLLGEDLLDPVSPEDQMLLKNLEERKHENPDLD